MSRTQEGAQWSRRRHIDDSINATVSHIDPRGHTHLGDSEADPSNLRPQKASNEFDRSLRIQSFKIKIVNSEDTASKASTHKCRRAQATGRWTLPLKDALD
jgi:hypothetical protein